MSRPINQDQAQNSTPLSNAKPLPKLEDIMEPMISSMLTLSLENERSQLVAPNAPRLGHRKEIDQEADLSPVARLMESGLKQPPSIPSLTNTLTPNALNSTLSQKSEVDSSSEVDKLTENLIIAMKPVINDLDNQILSVKDSQIQLHNLITTLMEELSTYYSMAHPPRLQADIEKLSNARRKLAGINATLSGVQERLDRILNFTQNGLD